MSRPSPARAVRRGSGTRATLIALSVCAVVLGRPASAQLAVDRLELTLVPRSAAGTMVEVFTVTNSSDRPVHAELTVEDWDRDELGDNRFFPLGTVSKSCGKALRIFPRTLTIDPRTSQTVRIDVEGTAAPSSACWAIVFVETTEAAPTSGRNLVYMLRTGVKVYIDPPGLARDGAVEGMQLRARADSARDIVLMFRNAGGLHLVTRGTVEFRRVDNSVAARAEVPDFPTLPGALRKLAVPVPRLAAGRYVVLAMLDYGGGEIAAGQMELLVP